MSPRHISSLLEHRSENKLTIHTPTLHRYSHYNACTKDKKQVLDDSLAETSFGGDIIGGLQHVVKQKGCGQVYASGLINLQSGVVRSARRHV